MRVLALVFIAAIALLHFYIAWFEIFSWEETGPRVFVNFPKELFAKTVEMAANQGIYNAFLACGLGWSLFIKNAEWQNKVACCFLIFVAVAGLFGAATVTTKTLVIQTAPAVIALILLYLSRANSSQETKR